MFFSCFQKNKLSGTSHATCCHCPSSLEVALHRVVDESDTDGGYDEKANRNQHNPMVAVKVADVAADDTGPFIGNRGWIFRPRRPVRYERPAEEKLHKPKMSQQLQGLYKLLAE